MAAAAWVGLSACGTGAEEPESPAVNGDDDSSVPAQQNLPRTAYGPVTPNEHFYVTSCCGNPAVSTDTWALTVKDRGKDLASLDYASLLALPGREKEHTLECISAGPGYLAISNALWTGLPLTEVFAAMGVEVSPGTLELVFTSVDGYTASLPVADLEKPVWLVWLMNGVALPREHGFPARLLVPGRYGMKNPKWIESIDFVDQPFAGYWDTVGWSKEAPYLTNTLVHEPLGDIPAGEIVASGTAFSGSEPILSVEVSVDEGEWVPATIDYSPGADVWTLWHHEMTLSAGPHTLQARCSTESGEQSGPSSIATDRLAGFDGSGVAAFTAV